MVRQLVGPLVQGAVGQPLIFEDTATASGAALGLLLEELMDAPKLGIWGLGAVPLYQLSVAFFFSQQLQFGDALFGVGHDAFEQGTEIAEHPGDAGSVEQVGVEF